MEISNPEDFATFLYNQGQKQKILNQDIEIQKDGLQHEEEQWKQALSIYQENGDKAKEEAVRQEITGLQTEQQNYESARQHLNVMGNILEDLKALPEIKDHYHRIEAAEQNLKNWSLPE